MRCFLELRLMLFNDSPLVGRHLRFVDGMLPGFEAGIFAESLYRPNRVANKAFFSKLSGNVCIQCNLAVQLRRYNNLPHVYLISNKRHILFCQLQTANRQLLQRLAYFYLRCVARFERFRHNRTSRLHRVEELFVFICPAEKSRKESCPHGNFGPHREVHALFVLALAYRLEKMLRKEGHRGGHDERETVEHVTQRSESIVLILPFLFKTVTTSPQIPHRQVVNKFRKWSRRRIKLILFIPQRRFDDKLVESRDYPTVENILTFPIACGFIFI